MTDIQTALEAIHLVLLEEITPWELEGLLQASRIHVRPNTSNFWIDKLIDLASLHHAEDEGGTASSKGVETKTYNCSLHYRHPRNSSGQPINTDLDEMVPWFGTDLW
jgi:hypothetical protein